MPKLYKTMHRITASSVFILLFVCTASAYTIVMRGGKRIEIPAKFQVSATTLTYEAGPEIQITLQLAAIDIPATERANNESPGSLLRRMGQAPADLSNQPEAPTATARRTITNRDLQSSMVRRRDSEVAYEKRRQELGLPSVAESRRRAEIESAQIQSELSATRSADRASESYWRDRASALRAEIAAVDAELDYVRGRLEDSPAPLTGGLTTTSVTPIYTPGVLLGNPDYGNSFPRARGERPPLVYRAPQTGSDSSARVGNGNGNTGWRRGRNNRGYGYPQWPGYGYPQWPGYGLPYPTTASVDPFGSGYDYSYERNALVTRFNELSATRAGLNARWRELEDEARRAGASPGWLRP
jgi:hypothetical protein